MTEPPARHSGSARMTIDDLRDSGAPISPIMALLLGIPLAGPRVQAPAAETTEPPEHRTCRYCRETVILGKRGWRRPDINGVESYDCPDAPRGYHGSDKP